MPLNALLKYFVCQPHAARWARVKRLSPRNSDHAEPLSTHCCWFAAATLGAVSTSEDHTERSFHWLLSFRTRSILAFGGIWESCRLLPGLGWLLLGFTSFKLSRFPCPRCGKSFFMYGPFFGPRRYLARTKSCVHCGWPKGADYETTPSPNTKSHSIV